MRGFEVARSECDKIRHGARQLLHRLQVPGVKQEYVVGVVKAG